MTTKAELLKEIFECEAELAAHSAEITGLIQAASLIESVSTDDQNDQLVLDVMRRITQLKKYETRLQIRLIVMRTTVEKLID